MENLAIKEQEMEQTGVQEQPWKIKSLDDADWAIRTIRDAEKNRDQKLDYIKREKERLKAFEDKVKKDEIEETAFLRSCLSDYIAEQKDENPKFKLETLNGSASVRTNKKWTYDDEAVLEALKKDDDLQGYIRIKEEINKAQMKKDFIVTGAGAVVTKDGEVIDGITVTLEKSLSLKFSE